MSLNPAPDSSSEPQETTQPTNIISLPALRRVTICEVCEKTPSKYCCPQCSIRYCSVPCFKLHRESSDSKNFCESRTLTKKARKSEPTAPEAPSSNSFSSLIDEELYAHPIPPERLARLLESDELQRLLRETPNLISTLRTLAAAPVAPQRANRPNRKRRRPQSDWVPPPDEFTHQLEAAFRDTKFASFTEQCLRIVKARK